MLTAIADEIMQKGIEKGELKERRVSAKKMKDEGLDIGLISRITGFSVEEIEEL